MEVSSYPRKQIEVQEKVVLALDLSSLGQTGAMSVLSRNGELVHLDIERSKDVHVDMEIANAGKVTVFRGNNQSAILHIETGGQSDTTILPSGLLFIKIGDKSKPLWDLLGKNYMDCFVLQ